MMTTMTKTNSDNHKHDETSNPHIENAPSMSWQQRELLQLLRRFNLVKGEGVPREGFNEEAYSDLEGTGWAERDEKFVYITNEGLEALKQVEDAWK